MSTTRHRELEEDFLHKPSLVVDAMNLLTEILSGKKMDKKEEVVDISADVTDTNFLVMNRRQPHSVKRSKYSSKKIDFQCNLNNMTFMRQIDVSQEERLKARAERESIANNYRRLGNAEYRKINLEKAIEFYTKGLDYISDSPIFYVNRALCYIKKRQYKRALLDLDYVINYLDSRCLRAWLYRAGALKRMNDEAGFKASVAAARRYNSSEVKYIESFLNQMLSDF